MQPLCVIDAVGLTPRHLGPATPHLNKLASAGFAAPMHGIVPALTCSAQASLLTGKLPSAHGIVGNGWFFRELGETRFWVQANALAEGEKLYETARKRAVLRNERFTCAKLFWWFNQGAAVDWALTPKPYYGCDGRKEFGIAGQPENFAASMESALGPFPFSSFWGPMAGLPSSAWIAKAAIETMRRHRPTLTLVYLPHLDYDLQRFGPDDARCLDRVRELDGLVGEIANAAEEIGATTVVLSEYGLVPVQRPVHINLELRHAGWLSVRPGPFGEMLDPFTSRAFAVADHQIAHVYVRDPRDRKKVAEKLRAVDGIARVLEGHERAEIGLDHARAGELIALSQPKSWFTYYYWAGDRSAPDFARTVDIHRKPGYDPCELFFDPKLAAPKLRAGLRLLQKKLGFRYRMDVVPLDASLVRGSHGLEPADALDGPIYLCNRNVEKAERVGMLEVKERLLRLLGLPE